MSSIKAFIPRILPDVTEEFVAHVFRQLNIGEITSVEVKSKPGDKNVRQRFAFITLNVFQTHMGDKLWNNIEDKKSTVIYYDSKETLSYWVVKPYIEKAMPKGITQLSSYDSFEMQNNITRLCRDLSYPAHSDEEDFNELSKAIDAEVQYYHHLWKRSVFSSYFTC
jgi:hypothetical protein